MDVNDFANQGWGSTKPLLIEPGVKYFLHQTLKQCHIVRDNFHNMVFNIGLFIAFLLVLEFILLNSNQINAFYSRFIEKNEFNLFPPNATQGIRWHRS